MHHRWDFSWLHCVCMYVSFGLHIEILLCNWGIVIKRHINLENQRYLNSFELFFRNLGIFFKLSSNFHQNLKKVLKNVLKQQRHLWDSKLKFYHVVILQNFNIQSKPNVYTYEKANYCFVIRDNSSKHDLLNLFTIHTSNVLNGKITTHEAFVFSKTYRYTKRWT